VPSFTGLRIRWQAGVPFEVAEMAEMTMIDSIRGQHWPAVL